MLQHTSTTICYYHSLSTAVTTKCVSRLSKLFSCGHHHSSLIITILKGNLLVVIYQGIGNKLWRLSYNDRISGIHWLNDLLGESRSNLMKIAPC
jgi:hypothetical protein